MSNSAISREQLAALCVAAQSGCIESRNAIIESNIGLVHLVVQRRPFNIHWQRDGSHLEYDDLVMEGIQGIEDAIRKYCPNAGAFSTYAYPWIFARVQRAIFNKESPIRCPAYLNYKRAQIVADIDRIAADTDAGDSQLLQDATRVLKNLNIPTAHDSLDEPLLRESDVTTTIGDLVPDSDVCVEDDALRRQSQNELQQAINLALDALTPRQREIIERRFGLNGHSPCKSNSLIATMSISRRVLDVELRAATKVLRSKLAGFDGLFE